MSDVLWWTFDVRHPYFPMITPQSAEDLILQHTGDFGTESISLAEVTGRVLREPVVADRDLPPFNRATMDGIALRRDAFDNGQRAFDVESIAAAGHPVEALQHPLACIRIMTGAMVPEGTDAVIPVEEFTLEENRVTLRGDYCLPDKPYIHPQGSDAATNDILLSPGLRMTSPRIGIAASVGKTHLKVSRIPRIAIISTGDEIIPVEETPEPFQIRGANTLAIQGSLIDAGYTNNQMFHYPDDADAIHKGLDALLQSFEVLILSGGVSMGEYDLIPGALDQLGVQKVFHKVKQRPGKPLWFGQHGGRVSVFGLPGNPLSTLTCLHRYLLPSLRHASRISTAPIPLVELEHEIAFRPALSFLPLVTVRNDGGRLLATPLKNNTSGDLRNPAMSDGFIECPATEECFNAGEIFPFWSWSGS